MPSERSRSAGPAPLVSIVTPAYNTAAFIGPTISSVRDQTFEDWELIVADDASDDETVALVRAAADAESRVRLVTLTARTGPAGARNAGLARARGRYVCFLDSDDLWLPGKLEAQLAFMTATGCAVSHTGYRRMSADGQRIGRCILPPERLDYRALLRNPAIANHTSMVDTGLTGPIQIDESGYRAHDYILWLGLARHGFEIRGLRQDLARYRTRAGSVSSRPLRSAYWVWRIYRDIENLDPATAARCLLAYGVRAAAKRLDRQRQASKVQQSNDLEAQTCRTRSSAGPNHA